PRVQRLILEVELHVAVVIAGSGAGHDLDAAKTDTAEFSAIRIVIDPDFLNLVLWRKAAAAETDDDETTGSAAAFRPASRAGDLFKVCSEFIFIVRQLGQRVAFERGGRQAGVRVETYRIRVLDDVDIGRKHS